MILALLFIIPELAIATPLLGFARCSGSLPCATALSISQTLTFAAIITTTFSTWRTATGLVFAVPLAAILILTFPACCVQTASAWGPCGGRCYGDSR